MHDIRVATVDAARCTGCGRCIPVCLDGIFSIEDGRAVARQEPCLSCGHCVAVCPEGAVTMPHGDHWPQQYAGFENREDWLPFGQGDTAELVRLMRSRRSCRNFRQDPVPREMLEDLARIGVTAPSGTNSQKWSFTFFQNRDAVLQLATPIKDFFRKLNNTAARSWLRKGLKLVGKHDLDDYYNSYYRKVEDALRQWEQEGKDLLFHGAPAVIMVATTPGASCPKEDAMLATQNMLLGAHTLGLGSCLIGYAVAALEHEPRIKTRLGLPRDEEVHAVLALGWPRESYARVTGRRRPGLRWVE